MTTGFSRCKASGDPLLVAFGPDTQCKEQGGGFKEVEADECVVRKPFVENQVAWQGWVGSKVRGQKRSLLLDKRPFEEWKAYPRKHVASQTSLHVDGARAFATQVDDKDTLCCVGFVSGEKFTRDAVPLRFLLECVYRLGVARRSCSATPFLLHAAQLGQRSPRLRPEKCFASSCRQRGFPASNCPTALAGPACVEL